MVDDDDEIVVVEHTVDDTNSLDFNFDFDFDFELDPFDDIMQADEYNGITTTSSELLYSSSSSSSNASPPPPPLPDLAASLSIGDIEHLLMNDDDAAAAASEHHLDDYLLSSDFLLDSPLDDVSEPNNLIPSTEEEKVVADDTGYTDADADDPTIKKRKRQLRNRDAAVRSRERKKMYVRDLEIKSRYLEGECKRLGVLLQCCFAENHALRLSVHNKKAHDDASMTKQESAVLLLESLLLGSLLWFLGIVCLLIPPRLLHPTVEALPLESVGSKNRGSLAPRKPGSKIFGLLPLFQSFTMSKRCKASRFRMKPSFLRLEVLV